MTDDPPYVPFYCEENVWQLARRAADYGIDSPHVVFVSSRDRAVAIWSQRASADPELPIVWDYHVVLAGRRGGAWKVFDPDCSAGFELTVQEWAAASFPFRGVVPPELEPWFRIVPYHDFEAHFRSDRSHMRNSDGSWKAPPPDWPPISESESNLWAFVDPDGDAPGTVGELDAFLEFF